MNYIVYDLEFNQDFTSLPSFVGNKASYPFEIIQIGAVKMDPDLNILSEFNRYVKPTIYPKISPFITELTHITTEQLEHEQRYPQVYQSFLEFIGGPDSIFCTWGKSDMKELFRMVEYFNLDLQALPRLYINLQPYASLHLHEPEKKLLRLQSTVEALQIPLSYPFHDALNDAYYTAEVFKKIQSPSVKPKLYDPVYSPIKIRPRQSKRTIDFEALLMQFEKMYHRPMSEEEQKIIKLAYQMGKTGQFITEASSKDALSKVKSISNQ